MLMNENEYNGPEAAALCTMKENCYSERKIVTHSQPANQQQQVAGCATTEERY